MFGATGLGIIFAKCWSRTRTGSRVRALLLRISSSSLLLMSVSGLGTSSSVSKKGFQRVAHVAIKNLSAGHPSTRIRAKVERWRDMEWGITGHPGVYSRQIARRLGMLSGLVTPRVQAAVFVTLWNGWCTHRRFQRRLLPSNRCVLGCIGGAEDAIEHYCRCPTILRVARHTLKFSYAVQGALDLWALNNSWLDDKDNLRAFALLVYGSFMTFNSCRYAKLSDSNQVFECIVQHCKQGAMGHATCMTFLDRRWQSPVSHMCWLCLPVLRMAMCQLFGSLIQALIFIRMCLHPCLMKGAMTLSVLIFRLGS